MYFMKTAAFHPFFCHKKKTRKTAWNTPEYLTEKDWKDLENVIQLSESNNLNGFNRFVNGDSRDFFYRVIGWPEGYRYCRESDQMCKNTLPFTHEIVRMKEALAKYKNSIA